MEFSPTLIVTGAAGFIGSAFAREALKKNYSIIILDALTYAGHLENIEEILIEGHCQLVQGDIADFKLTSSLFEKHTPQAIVSFAAESHVDNSIKGPQAFMETNIMGSFQLLESSRKYFEQLSAEKKAKFKFVHVSTDEVFGALGPTGKFNEQTSYAPNSPYSASKAASDHLVRAWFHTYGLPTITTNCSNNYGPRHFPEKLIPLMIMSALREQKLPVYGKGLNIRDWIHVEDHSRGVLLALEKGKAGESYCFGGNSERNNLQVVKEICRLLDEKKPRNASQKYEDLIAFVEDRKGHDFRYAIDDSKAEKELGFSREFKTFEKGLEMTVDWYLHNQNWVDRVERKKK